MTGPQDLIGEADRIGSAILAQGCRENGGMAWETTSGYPPVLAKGESLYAGVPGIALFFAELAHATGSSEYLDAAKDGIRWTEWRVRASPASSHGFYGGRLGAAYAMLRVGALTGEDHCDTALEMARGSLQALHCHTADLLTGVAGTLLGLLHLHAATGEAWLLEHAGTLADDLIVRAHQAKVGWYWDRNAEQVRGLCGLSHGASGIGSAFAELAHYTGNDAFAVVAQQAFAYERDHFHARDGKWPDFRRSLTMPNEWERLERSYLGGDLQSFHEAGEMNAWCHGAGGIGLSRLRAMELWDDELYADELHAAVRRIVHDLGRGAVRSSCLCHGVFGNAALLHAAAPRIDFLDCDEIVRNIVRSAITNAGDHGYVSGLQSGVDDPGLFLGTSGVGDLCLQLATGRRDSILLPVVEPPASRPKLPASLEVSVPEIHRRIVTRTFPRTCNAFMTGQPAGSSAAIFALEEARWRLAEEASLILLVTRARVHHERADELLPVVSLRLSPDAAIVSMPDAADTLLVAAVEGAREIPLGPLTSAVLAAFDPPCSVQDAVARLVASIDAPAEEVRTLACEQIREAFLSSILVPA